MTCGGGPVQVIIDGRSVLVEADLFHRLAGGLGYGPCHAHDLESLRGRLAGGDPRPVQLVWTHSDVIRLVLGQARFERFLAMLKSIEAQDVDKPWNERFVFRQFE